MNHDINIRKVRINCFKQSKVAGEFILQMRVPGAMVETKHLKLVQDPCERFGDGTFHLGTRQTFDIPGVKCENIEEINKYIRSYIHDMDVEMCDMDMGVTDYGYPAIDTRNIISRIGNTHCIEGNANTYEPARKIERLALPSHYHIKVAMAGCPNDCVKANFDSFGIMDVNKQVYDIDRCISCGSCVDACRHHTVGVLDLNRNGKIDKDVCRCMGYGERSLTCLIGAWTRDDEKLYRIILGGRTGKRSPRTGELLSNWVTEDVILSMFANWQKFSIWALDYKPEYFRGGRLIDRVGYKEFVKHISEGMKLNPETKMAGDISWVENEQRGNIRVTPLSEHKHAGPQEPAEKRAQRSLDYK